MTQFAFPVINPSTHNGTQLSDWLNQFMPSAWSSHAGATRPSYMLAGGLWVDSSGADLALKLFDGTADIVVGTFVDGVFTVEPEGVDAYTRSEADGRFLNASGDSMSGAILGASGTVAAPGFAFAADTDTGIWLNGAGNLAFTVAGVNRLLMTASVATFGTPLTVQGAITATGSIALPDGAGLYVGTNDSHFVRDGTNGNVLWYQNTGWRVYWDGASGAWLWQGAPGFVTNMSLDGTGNLTVRGQATIGALLTANAGIVTLGGIAFGTSGDAAYRHLIAWNAAQSFISHTVVGGSPGFLVRSAANIVEINSANIGGWAFATRDQSGVTSWVLYTGSSDARLKKNVKKTKVDALQALLAVDVVEFDWTEQGQSVVKRDKTHERIGFVADQVQAAAPEVVLTPPASMDPNQWKHIDHGYFAPYLVRAIQQLAEQVTRHRAALDALAAQIKTREGTTP